MKLALSLLAAPAIAFTAPQTTPTRAATQLFAYVPGVLRGAISLRRAAMVWREVAVCESTSYGIDATHTHTRRYVPSGMDPAAYAALKKKEAAASKKSGAHKAICCEHNNENEIDVQEGRHLY